MVNARRSRGVALVAFAVILAPVSAQQEGGIRGTVYDKDFEAPVAMAQVQIAETGQQVIASEDGVFLFDHVPEGKYTLVISKEGYARQVRPDIAVSPGKLTEVDVTLTGDFAEMEEFVVQDVQIVAGSEAALLELRFESPALMDSTLAGSMSRPTTVTPDLANCRDSGSPT